MAFTDIYRKQVELLVRTIPHVAQEACFALKGGTAINLFIRNMPRLSVDIDLTYLPVNDRAQALQEIDLALKRIAERIPCPTEPFSSFKGFMEDHSSKDQRATHIIWSEYYESQQKKTRRQNSTRKKQPSGCLVIERKKKTKPLSG